MSVQELNNKNPTLSAPNSGGNVWPRQSCPAFTPRSGAALNECWYCVYADFHLDRPRALDVGICEWPKMRNKKSEERT